MLNILILALFCLEEYYFFYLDKKKPSKYTTPKQKFWFTAKRKVIIFSITAFVIVALYGNYLNIQKAYIWLIQYELELLQWLVYIGVGVFILLVVWHNIHAGMRLKYEGK